MDLTFLFVCLKELLNAHREEREQRIKWVALVFMTISKAGVVCMLMTKMGRLLYSETVVAKPELLGLAKVTTSKDFLYLGLISVTGIGLYCSLFTSHKSGEI